MGAGVAAEMAGSAQILGGMRQKICEVGKKEQYPR